MMHQHQISPVSRSDRATAASRLIVAPGRAALDRLNAVNSRGSPKKPVRKRARQYGRTTHQVGLLRSQPSAAFLQPLIWHRIVPFVRLSALPPTLFTAPALRRPHVDPVGPVRDIIGLEGGAG